MSAFKCPVCRNSEADLTRIRSRYLGGEEVEKIAVDYQIDYDDMRRHCKRCIKVSKTRLDRYNELTSKLAEDIETAREAYQTEPERADLAGAYATLLREYRASIDGAAKLVTPEDQVSEITNMVLNPMFKSIMKNLTEIAGRAELEYIGIGASEKRSRRVTRHLLENMGTAMKESIQNGVTNMSTYFGVVDESAKLACYIKPLITSQSYRRRKQENKPCQLPALVMRVTTLACSPAPLTLMPWVAPR